MGVTPRLFDVSRDEPSARPDDEFCAQLCEWKNLDCYLLEDAGLGLMLKGLAARTDLK